MLTITLTKTKLALGILAMALAVPATAWAHHTFTDVADDRFYADAVEWAFDNEITTGTSATTFSPDDPVTRGQNVTFAKRYDDNIVQPALSAIESSIENLTNSAAVYVNGEAVATPIAGATTVQTLTITPPADGTVIVNSSVRISLDNAGVIGCSILTEDLTGTHQQLSNNLNNEATTLAGTRGFDATADTAITVDLVCSGFFAGNATAFTPTLTAVFAPG